MTTDKTAVQEESTQPCRPCYYRSPAHRNAWKPRLELEQLSVGQELQATVVQELLTGKTGPKLFCEVGVGRYRPQLADDTVEDPKQRRDWQIVTAMLRLPDRKISVARKRAARLRKKTHFPVYVSRIRPDSAALEVCMTREEALDVARESRNKIPTHQWQPGQVVEGRVVRVEDYGVFVDIGATRRHGLLHITTVANLLGKYINKAAGLSTTAGLTKGTRVQLQIANITHKEIALEFTPAAHQAAAAEREERKARAQSFTATRGEVGSTVVASAPTATAAAATSGATTTLSKEEEEAWAAFAANPSLSQQLNQEEEEEEEADDDDDDEDYDDYDEDRDIEDQLGLGYY